MQHVADDRHHKVVELLPVVADGKHVEQPLGGVGMPSVAGIHHGMWWRAVLCRWSAMR